MIELIRLYEEYIKLLGDELNDVVVMASIHGWKSDRVEQGEEMRREIAQQKALIESMTA